MTGQYKSFCTSKVKNMKTAVEGHRLLEDLHGDAFSYIMKAAHAYRGKWETSKKIPGQHREEDCVCYKQLKHQTTFLPR
ncbi:hypothetical protein IMY05_010G0107600 [Salix suchowensis]|nr:hypothetical protein IMY05_010G0107600 [Salix suchowensis]